MSKNRAFCPKRGFYQLGRKHFILWLTYVVVVTGCFYSANPVRKVSKALKQNNCAKALSFFQDVLSQNKKIKLAHKASSLCLNEAPKVSLWFYNYLSKYEKTKAKRLFFKKQTGDLAFERVKDYEQAISAYSFLLQSAPPKSAGTKGATGEGPPTYKKDVKHKSYVPNSAQGSQKSRFAQTTGLANRNIYSFRIAFSYFERGKWESALRTLKPLLDQSKISLSSKDIYKKALFLKARVLLMQREYQQAKKAFQTIKKLDPQYFREQEMFLYLSFIYEETKDFNSALNELRTFQHSSQFLREKIKSLKVRQKNQPGAGQSQAL